MATAVETYPHDYVDIEIVDVDPQGHTIRVGGEGSFRVKVINKGPLALVNVSVLVKGLNGALVKGNHPTSAYGTEFLAGPDQFTARVGPADGWLVSGGGPFRLEAPANTQPSRNLVRAELSGWEADLSPILEKRAGHVAIVNGTFAAEVGL